MIRDKLFSEPVPETLKELERNLTPPKGVKRSSNIEGSEHLDGTSKPEDEDESSESSDKDEDENEVNTENTTESVVSVENEMLIGGRIRPPALSNDPNIMPPSLIHCQF